MDAAKVADGVLARLGVTELYYCLVDLDGQELRDAIIEEIGKEVVAEACACVHHWRHDKS